MHYVIDIPEEVAKNNDYVGYFGAASEKLIETFKNGTHLPKEHGALKDVDKLKLDVFEYDEDAWMWASITKSGYSKEQIESLETIIEADKKH